MTSLWAIIKLTCRASLRSHIFHLLLFVLISTVALLPNTVLGDGTASGYIQVSLKYCLGAVGFILSLSVIWVSCFILSNDLETYQIHLVVTKPVSRIKVWVGKWLGVVLIHSILLFLSAGVVYALVLWQFYRKPFTPEEKSRIENEVLVGRRVTLPKRPDIDAMAQDEYAKRLKTLKASRPEKFQEITGQDKKKMLREIRKEIIAGLGEVRYGPAEVRYWDFRGFKSDSKNPLFFRYRVYVGKISSKEQRETQGIWSVRVGVPVKQEDGKKDSKGGKAVEMREVYVSATQHPEKIMCGVFHELALTPAAVDSSGNVSVAFINFDPEEKPVFFQFADGPKLLVKICGFFENYLRAVFILFLRLLFLAGLSCAAGGLLSMPTAVFVVISYLLLGIFSSFLIEMESQFGDDIENLRSLEKWHETAGRAVSHALLVFVIPLQKFEVSDTVAGGELVGWNFMAGTLFDFFVLRGLPLFLLGIWFYRRRELGMIIRK